MKSPPLVAVLQERAAGETRVAATAETVRKLVALGATVKVESGAGEQAQISDSDYEAAGATIGPAAEVVRGADIVLGVQGPEHGQLGDAAPGAWIVAGLDPFGRRDRVEAYAAAGLEALALDLMPRITRAQSMDILSSQSNLAGYKAVLACAHAYGRAFPMMMTAAGTITAARCFVMGVGVAGLQAIATARRLGAQVSATDVRSATREQIESLGAKPVFVEQVPGIEGEGSGGYATEMSEEYRAAQADLAAAFQKAVVEILREKTRRALALYLEMSPDRPAFAVAGGVAANGPIRAALTALCAEAGVEFAAPPLALCTDNAAMIAHAGLARLAAGEADGLDLSARPRWPLDGEAAPMIGSGRKGAKA